MRVVVFLNAHIALLGRDDHIGRGQIHKIAADNAAAVAEQGQLLDRLIDTDGQVAALAGRAPHQRLQLLLVVQRLREAFNRRKRIAQADCGVLKHQSIALHQPLHVRLRRPEIGRAAHAAEEQHQHEIKQKHP